MQKLNCKTNAAGWVPSSFNRTAQAFSQPGKGMPPIISGGIKLGTQAPNPTNTNKSGKSQQRCVSVISLRCM